MTERTACPLSREQLLARLAALTEAAVLIHRNPDGDAVGSGAALCRFLSARGVRATLLCADPIPQRLSFLTEGIPLETGTPRVVVTVDVASLSQVGEAAALLESADEVFSIDHHAVSTPFAPHYTLPTAAAAGEILFDLFCEEGPIPATIAYPLYAAIASDTGGFHFSNVTPATLRAAAVLLETGIDAADITHRLFSSKTDGELKAAAYAITHTKAAKGGRLRYLVLSPSSAAEAGCEAGDFDNVIDSVRQFRGCEVAALIRPRGEELRLSLRTTGADAAALCTRFGGGGHRRAAGCSLPAASVEEAEALFLQAAEELFR